MTATFALAIVMKTPSSKFKAAGGGSPPYRAADAFRSAVNALRTLGVPDVPLVAHPCARRVSLIAPVLTTGEESPFKHRKYPGYAVGRPYRFLCLARLHIRVHAGVPAAGCRRTAVGTDVPAVIAIRTADMATGA